MPKLSLSPVWYHLGTTWIGGIKIFYGELTAKSVVVDNVGPNNSSMKLIRIKEVGVGYFWQGCICVSLYFRLCIWPINQSFIQLRNPIGFSNRKIDIDKNCIDKHCIGLDGKKININFNISEGQNTISFVSHFHSQKKISFAETKDFTVCFQVSPQITCPRRGKVTLIAFIWLFSTVRV